MSSIASATAPTVSRGQDDRRRRHDGLLDRTAPALRGARRRQPGRPARLPAVTCAAAAYAGPAAELKRASGDLPSEAMSRPQDPSSPSSRPCSWSLRVRRPATSSTTSPIPIVSTSRRSEPTGRRGRRPAAAHHRGAAGPLLQEGRRRQAREGRRRRHAQGARRPLHGLHDRGRDEEVRRARSRAGTRASACVVDKDDRGRLMVTDVFEGRRRRKAGMLPGDEIVSVDGEPTQDKPVEVNTMRIKGPEGTRGRARDPSQGREADRGPHAHAAPSSRSPRPTPASSNEQRHRRSATSRLDEFADGVGEDRAHRTSKTLEAEGAEAIVLDLRYNPGGFLGEAVDVTSDFLEDGLVVITEGLQLAARGATRRPATRPPTCRWWCSSIPGRRAPPRSPPGRSRTTTAPRSSARARFGKGLVQSIVDLPDGATLKLTTAIYLTPDGTRHQQEGHQARHRGARRLPRPSRTRRSTARARVPHGRAARRLVWRVAHAAGLRSPPASCGAASSGPSSRCSPTSASTRSARGRPQPQLDDVVLAVPVKRNRMQIVEVLGTVDDLARGAQGAAPRATDPARVLRRGRATRPARSRRAATQSTPRAATSPACRTFTIDPDTARDFDDAISVERQGDGYRAWVHIADVSYYVDAGGAIDLEARRRTASVYLPLWAEPMLPESSRPASAASSRARPRKCVTVEFTFDGEGVRRSVAFYRSTIHSDHRLTYGFVDEVLGTGAGRDDGRAIGAGRVDRRDDGRRTLRRARVTRRGAARRRRPARPPAARRRAGRQAAPRAVRARRPADRLVRARVPLRRARPARSAPPSASRAPRTASSRSSCWPPTRRWPSSSNVATAMRIYRVHEPPDPATADGLLNALEELEVPTPPFPDARVGDRGRRRGRPAAPLRDAAQAERPRGPRSPRLPAAAAALAQAGALRPARTSATSACRARSYLHFTSPIRRYPDLRRAPRAAAPSSARRAGRRGRAELSDVAAHCSTMERTIAKLELVADDIALAFLLDDRLLEGGWDAGLQRARSSASSRAACSSTSATRSRATCRRAACPASTTRAAPGARRSSASAAAVASASATRSCVRVERVDRLAGKVELSARRERRRRRPVAGSGGAVDRRSRRRRSA